MKLEWGLKWISENLKSGEIFIALLVTRNMKDYKVCELKINGKLLSPGKVFAAQP